MKPLPLLITAGAAIGLAAYGPIPQPASYHQFADGRTLLSVPHAADVLSNVGFALVAMWGLYRLVRAGAVVGPVLLDRPSPAGRAGYALFIAALFASAVGSSIYHMNPDNARLVWDRLPIALACAGLLAWIRAETRPGADGFLWTVVLGIIAVGSVWWWHVTETAGRGDLRPYLLLQALPLVLIPLWQQIHGAPRGDRAAFGLAIALYLAAKVVELNDQAIYQVLGALSGHTLKHVLSAAAAAIVVSRYGRTQPRTRNPEPRTHEHRTEPEHEPEHEPGTRNLEPGTAI
jgi:hypothetical protein